MALKGNEYYKIRSKDGRDCTYNPIELLNKANEYFQWCIDNPLQEEQIVKFKDHYERVNVSKLRVYTITGLCNYLDMSEKAIWNYEQRADYIPIITRIRNIIYNQKFEGASSGFFKETLIIRDLKIRDTAEEVRNNGHKELSQSEIKQLAHEFGKMYGDLPKPITIDIDYDDESDAQD